MQQGVGGIWRLRLKQGGLSIPFVGFLRMQHHFETYTDGKRYLHITLNSLCGISSNATQPGVEHVVRGLVENHLSIPFVGFLRMQLEDGRHVHVGWKSGNSQFPLWDFFECNRNLRPKGAAQVPHYLPLNSLCGISSNATFEFLKKSIEDVGYVSQFPLWDFFECNKPRHSSIFSRTRGSLSIPFVGFLRMQRIGGRL